MISKNIFVFDINILGNDDSLNLIGVDLDYFDLNFQKIPGLKEFVGSDKFITIDLFESELHTHSRFKLKTEEISMILTLIQDEKKYVEITTNVINCFENEYA